MYDISFSTWINLLWHNSWLSWQQENLLLHAKNIFLWKKRPLLHGYWEMGGAWKHNGQMTTNVFRCLDTRGVSHYPMSHITPFFPTVDHTFIVPVIQSLQILDFFHIYSVTNGSDSNGTFWHALCSIPTHTTSISLVIHIVIALSCAAQ